MGRIGTFELILILAVVLLIFGPSRLPKLGKMVGGAFGKLRKHTQEQEWDDEDEDEEEVPAPKVEKVAEEADEAPEAEEKDV